MDNYDIDSLIERYKMEILELNKKRDKNIKEQNKEIEVKKKATVILNSTNSQKGAGSESKADDEISPLEREKTYKDGYILEDINTQGNEQSRRRFTADENKKALNMTKKNTENAKIKYFNFTKDLSEFGTLRVETVSSNMLYPVSNVHVIVYKALDDDNYFIYDTYTDGSGVVKDLKLPAPSKSFSQSPENNDVKPYSTYNIYVEHPYFFNTLYENVPIFDGITSIQLVEMIPDLDGTLSKPTLVVEKEPNDLGGV